MNKLLKYQWSLLFVFAVLLNQEALGWGATGHRAIAEIANEQLKRSTKKKIEALLGDSYLPLYATYADDVRSERTNPLSRVPHYVNMPFDQTYKTAEKSKDGDLVTILEGMIKTLKDKNATKKDKQVALKFIIHLVADAHQPLHVGLAEDLGGNKVDVKWFGHDTNLHRLWDSDLINHSNLSYMELARFADSPASVQKSNEMSLSVVDWIDDSQKYTKMIYENLGDKSYGYDYYHQFSPIMMEQIRKAGYHLGNLLNALMKDLKLSDLE